MSQGKAPPILRLKLRSVNKSWATNKKDSQAVILIMNMSLRGALPRRSSLLMIGDCFVGKSKIPPRNDILRIAATCVSRLTPVHLPRIIAGVSVLHDSGVHQLADGLAMSLLCRREIGALFTGKSLTNVLLLSNGQQAVRLQSRFRELLSIRVLLLAANKRARQLVN